MKVNDEQGTSRITETLGEINRISNGEVMNIYSQYKNIFMFLFYTTVTFIICIYTNYRNMADNMTSSLIICSTVQLVFVIYMYSYYKVAVDDNSINIYRIWGSKIVINLSNVDRISFESPNHGAKKVIDVTIDGVRKVYIIDKFETDVLYDDIHIRCQNLGIDVKESINI